MPVEKVLIIIIRVGHGKLHIVRILKYFRILFVKFQIKISIYELIMSYKIVIGFKELANLPR